MRNLKTKLLKAGTALKGGFFALMEKFFASPAQPIEAEKPPEMPWLNHYDPGVPRKIYVPNYSLNRFLDKAYEKNKAGTAFIYFGRKFTYGQLYELVGRMAAGLKNIGIRQGDRVAIVLPNIPQFMIAYWALHRLGAVVMLVNPLLTEKEIQYQLQSSGAQVAIVLDLLYHRIAGIRAQTQLNTVIVASIETYMPTILGLASRLKMRLQKTREKIKREEHVIFFGDILQEADFEQAPVTGQDPAVMLFTGGVTGTPKAAMLSHRNLVANTLQARAWLNDIRYGQEVIMAALPFFHSYGMTACHHLAIHCAATLILQPRFNTKAIVKGIEKYKVSVFPGVPTMFSSIVNEPIAGKLDLSTVRACISGGAPLPIRVKQSFEKMTNGTLVEGYGLTEASPVTHCNPIYGRNKIGSIGLPWPGTEARIVDLKSGEIVPSGQTGELEVRGPQVMMGYWQNEDETRNVLSPDGWLKTGDIAKCDEEGYFYIVDRKKDVIFSGGYNIYPSEVEAVLLQHPFIEEAAVVGIANEYYGEAIKAYIILKKGVDLSQEQIRKFCEQSLAKYKIPREIEFVQELPKNFLGKVVRRKLAKNSN